MDVDFFLDTGLDTNIQHKISERIRLFAGSDFSFYYRYSWL